MNRTKIKYREWEFEVEKELTHDTYLNIYIPSSESCGCSHCRNFALQREEIFSNEIKSLFEKLGIDYGKETEISHFGKLENGLHHYTGWFHFKGDFIGKDCAIPLNNGFTIDFTPINETFGIGFRKSNNLTQFVNNENLVQIEFECRIPWKLSDEVEPE